MSVRGFHFQSTLCHILLSYYVYYMYWVLITSKFTAAAFMYHTPSRQCPSYVALAGLGRIDHIFALFFTSSSYRSDYLANV